MPASYEESQSRVAACKWHRKRTACYVMVYEIDAAIAAAKNKHHEHKSSV
jgi:hypothetical protein